MGGFFHHAQHHPIEHFHSHRRDGARGDFGHRASGVLVGFVYRQSGLDGFRLAHQARGYPRDQRHGALRPGQQARQIVSRQVELGAAGLHHRAIGQHHFEPQHVVGGDPVRQGVRSAGVFGDVAADGAGALAGRVPVPAPRPRNGTANSCAILTISDTSRVLRGNTTTSGRCLSIPPSYS